MHQQQIPKERDHGHVPTHDSLWENKIARKKPKDGNERPCSVARGLTRAGAYEDACV